MIARSSSETAAIPAVELEPVTAQRRQLVPALARPLQPQRRRSLAALAEAASRASRARPGGAPTRPPARRSEPVRELRSGPATRPRVERAGERGPQLVRRVRDELAGRAPVQRSVMSLKACATRWFRLASGPRGPRPPASTPPRGASADQQPQGRARARSGRCRSPRTSRHSPVDGIDALRRGPHRRRCPDHDGNREEQRLAQCVAEPAPCSIPPSSAPDFRCRRSSRSGHRIGHDSPFGRRRERGRISRRAAIRQVADVASVQPGCGAGCDELCVGGGPRALPCPRRETLRISGTRAQRSPGSGRARLLGA
jgi:hypothetical protein